MHDRKTGSLPNEYLVKGLAVDWWSLLKNEWGRYRVFKNEASIKNQGTAAFTDLTVSLKR